MLSTEYRPVFVVDHQTLHFSYLLVRAMIWLEFICLCRALPTYIKHQHRTRVFSYRCAQLILISFAMSFKYLENLCFLSCPVYYPPFQQRSGKDPQNPNPSVRSFAFLRRTLPCKTVVTSPTNACISV